MVWISSRALLSCIFYTTFLISIWMSSLIMGLDALGTECMLFMSTFYHQVAFTKFQRWFGRLEKGGDLFKAVVLLHILLSILIIILIASPRMCLDALGTELCLSRALSITKVHLHISRGRGGEKRCKFHQDSCLPAHSANHSYL